jgi:hypothetical protein
MLDNHCLNLMRRLVQESDALWCIKNHCEPDADGCEVCVDSYKRQVEEKERTIAELTNLVRACFD